MANLITFLRLISVFIISAIALYADTAWQLSNVPLIMVNILLDGLDGLIARKYKKDSLFGAIFDIAADRIIEITLWITLAQLHQAYIWVALIFVTRGVLVDSIRKTHTNQGQKPFNIMQNSFSKFLVASRTMRFASGFFKLATFSWLFFLSPAAKIWPQLFITYGSLFDHISSFLIGMSITICLARGIPVIIEAVWNQDNK